MRVTDVLDVVGLLLLAVGAFWLAAPLGFIVLGVSALLVSRARVKRAA